ncbi:unnamed protein product [Adineta ricciae]|uniref:Methyltransferase type 11 domain-containing protein n=1 Tax=Adineta ricciae TaxID=249248 RepID=A0A815SHH2_ADIRI|nr:unnamed protein product [Adineta ricciae]CAF1489835.1 unnamed protein product [Adineta ricciae]
MFRGFFVLIFDFLKSLLFSTGPRDRIYKYVRPHLNTEQKILNVGCGDGILSELIRFDFPGISIHDIDVVDLRSNKQSQHFHLFDGYHLSKYANETFDVILIIYVLHHVRSREILLEEAMRVGKKIILIEDILNEPNGTCLDRFFTFTHRIWAKWICHDQNAYVEFWTKSKWFSILLKYRNSLHYEDIPEKKWYHYVNHGLFLCQN